ncbi:hypothetical protein [Flavobacterium sp. UBA7682]|uniref:hypothetical protein n=1 Tax=Flavobacterium sp. UBA7682 TaxID=1946560 RepID=UPI0025C0BBB8|nr:hypothetical protein [Flavobacterium sp. UBA7682]
MKKNILTIVIAIATLVIGSCNNNSKKEAETDHKHEGHHHDEDVVHPQVYVCPVNCNNGKTFIFPGECSICKLDLVEQEHSIGDGHDNPIKGNIKSEKEDSKQSSIDIEQLY